MYTRTGNLGRSPRTSGVQSGGSSAGFDAYLEPGDYSGVNAYLQSLGFRSYFSGLQALTAAETGSYHVLGNSGFWARAESRIGEDFYSSMASHFG